LYFSLISPKFTATWGKLREDLSNLALSLNSFALYLDLKNEDQQKRQKLEHPARQVGEHAWIDSVASVESVSARYSLLDNAMSNLADYEYLLFDEQLHAQPFENSMKRYYFLHNIALSVPINILS
jgi:hypothetical protein